MAELELPLDDEEFLTNYVALLKAISVRLSKDTVGLFDDVLAHFFGCFYSAHFFGAIFGECFIRCDFSARHVFQLDFSTRFSAHSHVVGLFCFTIGTTNSSLLCAFLCVFRSF